MQIKGSRILILGGWGLVGSAICRKIIKHSPDKLIVSSLHKAEAEDAVDQLRKEFPNVPADTFEAKWGNIFTRNEWKDEDWGNVLNDGPSRKGFINDIFFELSDDVLERSSLYSLVKETKPDLVIDCINTATAIAYLDIYNTAINAIKKSNNDTYDSTLVEQVIASTYIPQLIRHVQILYRGLQDAGSTMYFKIGTSGTGGMGMNIPYTHSEERPSRVLLSKTAVAGAQTLLLYLLARTPDGPLVKEIKPTAAIAWKKVAYGDIKKKGKPIQLVDMAPENAKKTIGDFVFDDHSDVKDTGEVYKSAYIDTGENGIFSKGEFTAISSLGQMEIVTPEEIAEYTVHEILGGNTGRDVIQGLDAFTLGPTYRGGLLRNEAIKKLDQVAAENNSDSVAFELLGPPRLSKLLYEANLIKKICGSLKDFTKMDTDAFVSKAEDLLKLDQSYRAEMLSIGLVILMSDGETYLRGKDVKIPVRRGDDKLEFNQDNVNQWCYEGWIDLRKENFVDWKNRINKIIEQAELVPADETGSRFTYSPDYWNNFDTIDEGKIAGWIFENEDKGWRFKR